MYGIQATRNLQGLYGDIALLPILLASNLGLDHSSHQHHQQSDCECHSNHRQRNNKRINCTALR